MAMNGDALAAQLLAELGTVPAEAENSVKILCRVLVQYIQQNAQVAPGITVVGTCPAGAVSGATTTPGQVL
jgi:hypothetical protein